MKKVAHICTSAISHKILRDKLNNLKNIGYEIHLISSKEGYDEEFMNPSNIKLHFLSMSRNIHLIKDLISTVKLFKLIKREKYDIVHTHTAKAGVIGRMAAKLAGVSIVIHTSHGLPFYEGQSRIKYRIYKTLESIGSLFCDGIASQNKEDMDKIKKIAPKKTIFYEGNGVDLPSLDQIFHRVEEHQLAILRKELDIDEEKKIVLVGARFEEVKGHFFLIEGIKRLVSKGEPNFVFLFAGKGPLEDEIKNKIREYELESYIFLIGHQKNIYPYIKLADIVTLTSQKEGIPRIIMEAMAFSKPIVATNVLGTKELVINGETGKLVPYNDVNALSEELYLLINDDRQRRYYGTCGRKRIESEFTEEIVARRIDKIYKSI